MTNSNLVSDLLGTAKGGGSYAEKGTLSLTRTTVNANRAVGLNAYGGGMYALNSAVSLVDSTVNGNWANGSAVGQGGGIFSSGGTLSLWRTMVKGNLVHRVRAGHRLVLDFRPGDGHRPCRGRISASPELSCRSVVRGVCILQGGRGQDRPLIVHFR